LFHVRTVRLTVAKKQTGKSKISFKKLHQRKLAELFCIEVARSLLQRYEDDAIKKSRKKDVLFNDNKKLLIRDFNFIKLIILLKILIFLIFCNR